jgi:hypothetical protein
MVLYFWHLWFKAFQGKDEAEEVIKPQLLGLLVGTGLAASIQFGRTLKARQDISGNPEHPAFPAAVQPVQE